MNPTGTAFTSQIFNLFQKWENIDDGEYDEHTAARRAVARGEHLFNTLPIPITGVAGLNDVLHVDTINGFCGTCHDSPNVGDHSVPAPLNIGLADASRRTPDLPLITVMCNATGQLAQVTDIGRAMVTGKCADIGKFKGPVLRGLAARAPYFHNGSAATLLDAVNFYDTRFSLHLSQDQKDDLVAFLNTLCDIQEINMLYACGTFPSLPRARPKRLISSFKKCPFMKGAVRMVRIHSNRLTGDEVRLVNLTIAPGSRRTRKQSTCVINAAYRISRAQGYTVRSWFSASRFVFSS